MKEQSLTARHQRLREYLIDVCKLKTETFNFGDTYGQAQAIFNEEQLVQTVFAKNQPEDTVDPVPGVFNYLPTEVDTRLSHEYVLHLIVQEFGGDFTLLLSQLLFWKAQEKQDIKLDYKLTWNNEKTVDINFYFDIAERTKITESNGIKTC